MPESILTTTKAALGLEESYVEFDPEITMHINSVLGDFNQLGLGPDDGFAITGATQTWEDFLGTEPRYDAAKSLMYLQVKMLFDPPTVGYVITAMEKMIEKAEWRVNIAREEIVHPAPPEDVDLEAEVVLDGDPS